MKARIPGAPQGGQAAMLQRLQDMQDQMQRTQEEVEATDFVASAGGGVVGVKINGKKEILSINIEPEIVDPDDIETLSDILVAAVNEAIKKVNETNSEEMSKVTGALNIPGMPGMF